MMQFDINKQFKNSINWKMLQHQQPNIEFDNDYFSSQQHEDYQFQNYQIPTAIPIDHQQQQCVASPLSYQNNSSKRGYELTFKKQQPFRYISNHTNLQMPYQNLFSTQLSNPRTTIPQATSNLVPKQTNQNKQNQITKNADYKFIAAIQNCQSFIQIYDTISEDQHLNPLAQQQQLKRILLENQVNSLTKIKIETLTQMLIIKNLRRKRNSAKLNIQIMKTTIEGNQISQTDKKRLELLELLVMQLEKKIFIEQLRYNKIKVICGKVLADGAEDIQKKEQCQFIEVDNQLHYQQQLFNNEFIALNMSKQNKKQQQDSNINNKVNKNNSPSTNQLATHLPQAKNSPYYMPKRLTIFNQIIGAILSKVLFSAFRAVHLYQSTKQSMKDQHSNRRKLNKDDPVLKLSSDKNEKQHINKDIKVPIKQQIQANNYDDSFDHPELPDDKEKVIQKLYEHIREIKKQAVPNPSNPYQLLKTYFIKWRVHFLNSMIMRIETYEGQQNNHNQLQIDQYDLSPHTKNQQNGQHLPSQVFSNKSNENDLKQQKGQLKQFLRICRIHQFLKNLQEVKSSKGIKQITTNYYIQNLKRKAFDAFCINKQQEVQSKQIQIYASYISQNQNQQQITTATLLHKTNCLAKFFFALKTYVKCLKFANKLQKTIFKLSFMAIKHESNRKQQNQTKLQRYFQRRRKQLIFKYFNIFKNSTSFSEELNIKINNFRNRKNRQLLEFSFSVLSLEWKKKLALIKRAERRLLINDAKQFFKQLACSLNRKRKNDQFEYSSYSLVTALRKQHFFVKFQQYYLQALKRNRIQIKKVKLQIQLSKSYAARGLFEWRRLVLCKKNFQVIQNKLRNVKKLQQKGKIFKIWTERFMEKTNQHKKDKLTSNHKVWLNKYYQKLCLLQQEQNC